MKKIIGLIPTRLESKRLPGKALLDLDGLPLIIHTAKRAMLSKLLKQVFVCTDSDKIIEVCKIHDVKFIKTQKHFINGTERIASVVKKIDCDFVIDIQGDEPLISPDYIDQVVKFHLKIQKKADIIIPCIKANYNSPPSVVRVLCSRSGKIMYLSRANIPYQYSGFAQNILKHLSVISFTKKSLLAYSKLKQSYHENIEDIELLRALENDFRLFTIRLEGNSFSVDVNDDYLKAKIAIKADKIRKMY